MMHMSLPGLETEITTIAIGLLFLGSWAAVYIAVKLYSLIREMHDRFE
jgi:hypothetical protein